MSAEFQIQFPPVCHDLGGTLHRPPDIYTTPDGSIIHFNTPEGFIHLVTSKSLTSNTKYLLGLGSPDQKTHTVGFFDQKGKLTSISTSLVALLHSKLTSYSELDSAESDNLPPDVLVMQNIVSGLLLQGTDVTACLDVESWRFIIDSAFFKNPVSGEVTNPTFYRCVTVGGPSRAPLGFLFSIERDSATISFESRDAIYSTTRIPRRPPFHLITGPVINPALFSKFVDQVSQNNSPT